MASKFIALFALVAVASAQHYHNDYYNSQYDNHYAAPAVIKQVQPAIIKQVQPALIKKVAYEHEEPANYQFNYDVHDPHTGDIKRQQEVAQNGAIQGEYSLIDADGYRRIVSYTADDHHGFQAQVRREPVEGHKIVAQPAYAKAYAPVAKVYAQPAIAVQKYAAPVYSAPSYQKYAAPAQVYSAPVVQKYVAPAPVVEKYVSAPVVQKYVAQAPVVQKYVAPAPVYSAPVAVKAVAPVVKYSSAEHSAHVAVNGPHYNYHY